MLSCGSDVLWLLLVTGTTFAFIANSVLIATILL